MDVISSFALSGLCGGSASGKTTVANKIIEQLGVPWVCMLSLDSFYKVGVFLVVVVVVVLFLRLKFNNPLLAVLLLKVIIYSIFGVCASLQYCNFTALETSYYMAVSIELCFLWDCPILFCKKIFCFANTILASFLKNF